MDRGLLRVEPHRGRNVLCPHTLVGIGVKKDTLLAPGSVVFIPRGIIDGHFQPYTLPWIFWLLPVSVRIHFLRQVF